jgi:hypothetical protein
MEERRTIDTILEALKDAVEGKVPVSPADWLESALYLNTLREDLQEELISAEMAVAEKLAAVVGEGGSVAKAEVLAKATPEYKKLLELKAKDERVSRHITICNNRARLSEY